MKAIRVKQFGGFDVLETQDTDDPEPGAGQILVRMHAAGINPVDSYIVSGRYARKPQLPFTPGSDGAGIVEATGRNVTNFKPGDRVYLAGSVSGSLAELALCTVDQVHPLPEATSFEQGAALGVPYGTAYRALFQKAKTRPGETVMIHGASGGVGLAAVQLAVHAGFKTIGTAGSVEGRELVKRQGAHLVLDHNDDSHFKEAADFTGGRGIDVILEMLANVNLAGDLPVLAQEGRVVVIGSKDTIEINPRDIMMKDSSVIGMLLFNATLQQLNEIHSALYAGLAGGVLKPVIQASYPLDEAPAAFNELMNKKSMGKVVLTV